MNQGEYEHWMLKLIGTGTVLAVLEFLVVSLVFGGGTIGGFMDGFLAGAAMVVVVVVLVWLATIVIRPSEAPDKEEPSGG